jgi:hypothetical protein
MTPPLAGQPGHGSMAFVRSQPVRIVDGRFHGGYTDVYELICPSCGDHPYMDYTEVLPRLQRLRGPRTLTAALAAYHEHLGLPWPNEDSAGSLGPGAAKIVTMQRHQSCIIGPGQDHHAAVNCAVCETVGPMTVRASPLDA